MDGTPVIPPQAGAWRVAAWAAPALLAALLAGCAGASSAVELVGDDPLIVVQQRGGEGMDALIEARLRYDPESRCLLLDQGDGGRTAPVWPRGTSAAVEGGRHGVDVPGHGLILDGDVVAAGGGYQGRDDIDGLPELGLPDTCLPERVFLFSGDFPER